MELMKRNQFQLSTLKSSLRISPVEEPETPKIINPQLGDKTGKFHKA